MGLKNQPFLKTIILLFVTSCVSCWILLAHPNFMENTLIAKSGSPIYQCKWLWYSKTSPWYQSFDWPHYMGRLGVISLTAWRCPVFSLSGSWLLCSSGVAFGDAGSVAGKGRWINMGTLPLRMDLYGFVMIYQILWRGHEVRLRIITCLFQSSQVPTEMPTSPMSDLGDDTAGGPQLWSLRRRCWPSGGQNGVSLLLTLV